MAMHLAIDLAFSTRAPAESGDVELVSLLIAPVKTEGTLTSAARLLDHAGSLDRLASMSARDIAAVAKIRTDRALRLVAALELGRRVQAARAFAPRETVDSFAAVERWAAPRLAHLEHEEVWLLCLDGRNALKTALRVARGGAHGCALTPKICSRPRCAKPPAPWCWCTTTRAGIPRPAPKTCR